MDLLLYILILFIGLLIGIFIGRKSMRCDGLFLVDDTDDNTVQWILDVKIDPMTIPNHKEIHLKVKKMDQNKSEGSCE